MATRVHPSGFFSSDFPSPQRSSAKFLVGALIALSAPSLLAQDDPENAEPWNPHHTDGREEELAQEILALPDGDVKWLALSGLTHRWVTADAEAAWKFGRTLKGKEARVTFYRATMPYYAENDPGRVLEALAQNAWWPDQWIHVRDATMKMADYDLDRAVESFADATPERMQLGEIARQLARKVVVRDSPEEGFAFADRLKERKRAYQGAVQGTLQEWVKIDENAALAYAEDEEDPEMLPFTVSGILTGKDWLQNPDETVGWIVELSEDRIRRHMLVNLVYLWKDLKDPDQIKRIVEDDRIGFEDRNYLEEQAIEMGIYSRE